MSEIPLRPKVAPDDDLSHVDSTKIGALARKGAVWSVIQIVVRNVVSIGSTAVLARLLSPDDYGLMGMVATLTALLLVFSDMGLSWATIQRRELTRAQVSNLFWINVGAGLALWLACIVVAPVMAGFYEREELRLVTMVLGASFLIGALSAQPFALLKRRMDFRAVARIEIAAGVMAAVTGIGCALAGMGYWALVAQAIVGQLTRAVLAIPASRIRLQAPVKGAGTREMVSFGGLLAINGLLIYLARNLDSILIGKVWGTEQLGYYDRAYFLMLLPSLIATGALANLMVPSLSALQDHRERFGDAYRRALRMVAFVGCPMAAGLALVAPEAVQAVYGSKWLPVVPILIWLSLAGVSQPIYKTTGWLFTASGKAGVYLAVTVINAAVLAAAFFWGVQGGAIQVAMAYGIAMGTILLWPTLWLAHRAAGIEFRATLVVLAPVLACLLVMIAAVVVTGHTAAQLESGWMVSMIAKVVAGVVAYTLSSALLMRNMINTEFMPLLRSAATRFRAAAA